MNESVRYQFFMSQLTHIKDIKDTEKTTIAVVFNEVTQSSCILRICKNRDLTAVCEALCKIRNQNTVVVYDYIYENGNTYILEENVSGTTVLETIDNEKLFSEDETATIILEVCKALEVLHQMDPPVIHNDINPSNIMVHEDGNVKLFDFDIARTYKKERNQNTILFGTEEYASPEHYGYGQSEPRTDIYCLGVTMHKMLTGRGLSNNHRMTYNGKLQPIIQKCLEINPNDRYVSASDLKDALLKFLDRKRRFARRSLLVATAVLSIVAMVPIRDFVQDIVLLSDGDASYESNIGMGFKNADESCIAQEQQNEHVDIMPSTTETKGDEEANDSRERAKTITLNQEYLETIETGSVADWYKFTTTENEASYRIYVNSKVNDTPVNGHTYVCLYDQDGYKLEEIYTDYSKDAFLDIRLDREKEYTIKIFAENTVYATGDYLLCISEHINNAGPDKENAIELQLNSNYEAQINSTLSGWYVFETSESGRYTVEVHNIDTGSTIYFNGERNGSSVFSGWSRNEDIGSRMFNAESGDMIYIEVNADDLTADGNYIISVKSQ